ncbi:Phage protein Gp37/Gp68 [Leptospira santarosai]|uniref:Phage protein Gp37/Gp68 n=1 Tax=Leptospira santarosai TaxID=28183 RepID=A0A2P1QVK3_9LEPT|nr:Phage protein Gp37/Gp68 [Leptospira santarosai]
MSIHSNIEWTDATWNPTRGCSKISPGCKNCYAETLAERFRGIPDHPFEFGFDLRLVPEKLIDPIQWRTPKKIFVNSMSDLFHKNIPDEYIFKVFSVMKLADWHIYQVLTKRPERMKKLFDSKLKEFSKMKHIWCGVSVEDRKNGLPRIKILRETNVSTRFLSIEPLLEDLGDINLKKIDWVIVGGESGPRSRPLEERWVLSIKNQCKKNRVPFFFKQWGGVRKQITGRMLHGKTFDEFPKIQKIDAPVRSKILDKLSLVEQFV